MSIGSARALSWAGLLMLLVPASVAAQTGTVAGQVTAADTEAPIPDVLVLVAGTNRSGLTDQEGRYRITGVPIGARAIRASSLGYGQAEQTATVVADGTVTVDFTLPATAIELGGILVDAVTGQRVLRRGVANSVGRIDVDELELGPVTSIGQLLQGRVAGAVVQQTSGTTGMGSRIRIRGNNSISLANGPLIVVDGVRVENSEKSLGFGVGGQGPSRLDDLNPEDIASIDILKGPAASAIYGTAAANGVLVITTRRGQPGAPRFSVWSEVGELEQTADFPDNVYILGDIVGGAGTGVGPGAQGRCDNLRRANGANPGAGLVGCTNVVETYRFNPLANSATTPFRNGQRRSLGASISGGGAESTFYVSMDYEREIGVLPENDLRRVRLQANLDGTLSDKVTASAHVGITQHDAQLPQGDNALFGIVPMGLYGSAQPQFVDAQMGFASDPAFFYDWKTYQDFTKVTASAQADYTPFPWLTLNGLAGIDRYARNEFNRIPHDNAYSIFGSVFAEGFIQDYDYDIFDVTTNASATAFFDLRPDLASITSVGTAYLREDFNQVYAFGATLTPGIEESLTGANTDFDVDEENILNSTLGAFAQQRFAWRDRLFVNAAVRGDKNTAFGTSIGWIWYPAVSAAWLISEEEDFFTPPDWLDELRLRAAFGQSGLRPGATDALQSFASTVGVFENQGVPAATINEIGNAELKPERSTEWEGGIDVGMFDGRLGVDLTYYHKTSRDALVNKPLPPSLGSSANRFENLGEVRNNGFEVQLNAEPYRNDAIRWNVGLGGSFSSNELVDLGQDAQGEDIPPILNGFDGEIRRTEGYPLFSFFHPPIVSFNDANGDGLLSAAEVEVADDVEFLGTPYPKREFQLSTNVTYRDWLRVSALLDYKGGHKQMNYTRANRCGDMLNCAEIFDPSTPLEKQAEIVAYAAYGSYAGMVEDADFLKLRELAVTFIVPQQWAQRIRANQLSITLAGRNLHTWTGYSGLDPEVAFNGASTTISGDAATLPLSRYIALRFDAIF